MAEILVELFVWPIVENVISTIGSMIKEEVGLLQGLKTEAEKLSSNLTSIQATLKDAEDRQVEERAVRDWLAKLKNELLNAEDILETFATEAALSKTKQKMRTYLDTEFTGAEVRRAVFDMGPMKAPGIDGLPALFYQKFWGIIGQNVVETIANRFRKALDEVISESQSAFIPGSLISDNRVVGFKCLHSMKLRKRKHGSIAIKLDMSKAYDSVEWGFIEQMMLKLGFSEEWVSRIMRCVSTIVYSFLLNGESVVCCSQLWVSGRGIPSRHICS
ncbi:hypothetical protein Dsin_021690 [Dipteronia sinensis]|uniref:Disease resistance N-terminal domain-containing protein n=1 Tax=Dipteronia sinensis TaxID=43782 RepID=A0AAE0A0M3_9ROSI|nr:hypothetical protein Dsin_021690 [Dipteronia sinensis]